MDFFFSLLGFIIGIGILVFVHELGHFLMAKICGVRVEKFSIGFPPKITSLTYGKTEYVLGALPLGGYVKMAGMIDENMDKKITGAADEFMSKNTFQKSLILLGGVLFNIIFAIFIFFIFNLLHGTSKLKNEKIVSIHHSSILKKYLPEDNITITKINQKPIIFYDDIKDNFINNLGYQYPIEYQLADGTKKTTLIPESLKVNEELFSYLRPSYTFHATIYVRSVQKNSLAEKVGLQSNDTLLFLAQKPISSFATLENLKEKYAGQTVPLVFKRSNTLDTVQLHLTRNQEQKVMIGFQPGIFQNIDNLKSKVVHIDYQYSQALSNSIKETFRGFILNFQVIRSMIKGNAEIRENVGGPIAIANILGKSFGNFEQFAHLLAFISVMLAFANILPIPGLDGGHLAIVLIEGIRGKPLNVMTKMKIQKIGFVIVLALMIFVLTNDISRLF